MELIETCFLTSVVVYHNSVTLGGSTEHFTTNDGGFRSYGPCKMQCVSDNAVQEFRNRYRIYENVGLMMYAKTQDTWQRTIVNKTDYREVTVYAEMTYTL